jgi:hypothetical protein
VISIQTDNEMLEFNTLKPFTNYSVVITIENDVGSGPPSLPVKFHTPEDSKFK